MDRFKKRKSGGVSLNLSPMIDVTFLLIIYFIVTLQMEPSLDNIIKLPPVFHATKQEDALLQIYVLPANILPGGNINKDSTGLVAFSDKARTPDSCPVCRQPFKDANQLYIPNSLVDGDGKPIVDLKATMANYLGETQKPPAFKCAKCNAEISPYLKLDEIPRVLKSKKEEVLKLMVRRKNFEREKKGEAPMTEQEIDAIKDEIPLMIKADDKAFYGRILQVVNMAKDTTSKIKNVAFITRSDAAEEVQSKKKGK
jgi:biopolymer transport protein ExbD